MPPSTTTPSPTPIPTSAPTLPPTVPESRRRSGRSAHESRRYERQEKAKSSQSYAQYYGTRGAHEQTRQGSAESRAGGAATATANDPSGYAAQRPRLKDRTHSAPLVELQTAAEQAAPESLLDSAAHRAHHYPAANELAVTDGQDEDEVAGVVGAVRYFQPFRNPELSEPLPEINIVVVGAEGVGKSTFVQKALELPNIPDSQAAERKLPVHGRVYLVRLLELPIEDIEYDDETINWPDVIDNKMMPRVDGVLALYNIKDKDSVAELPEMLSAITKASVPAVLVSCKCDAPLSERELDPDTVEQHARRSIGGINTLQVSKFSLESSRRGISTLLNDIVRSKPVDQARSSSARRRAQSSAVRPASPRHTNRLGHSRASSEFTGGLLKELRHTRHDSTIAGHSSGDRWRVPEEEDQMQNSFLLEESASETSPASSSSSIDAESQGIAGAIPNSTGLSEYGMTFDELVDRLLAQPTSKSDLKFGAVFLALYRKFAAPGQLLEAIVERFDALERNGVPQILKTQMQLRYVGVIEQWCGWYPGDFAYPKTRRRLRTFIGRLAELRVFAQAAREINIDLEAVREDDDTHWAYCDRDREASLDPSRSSISSIASTLLDDPSFSFDPALSGSTLGDASLNDYLPKFANEMIANVEQSQQQAELLQAIPRNPITKVQWRALMDQPDDMVARELTRMDWIMFSSIRPRDLVRDVSCSKDEKSAYKNLAHVDRMVEHFNQLARWVANYVLFRDKPKHRALMLEKFMRIARKLREINNYNALGAIIAGVKSTAVHRLGATRELLPPAVGKDWMKLEILMSPSRSHSAYRLAWENSSSERIPYLPLHRRDLAAAEEGNKTFLDGDETSGRINWKKFEIMGDVIVCIQRAQGLPYRNLGGSKGNEQIRELVLDVKLVKDEEDLYDRSVQCEPIANTTQGTTSKFRDFFKR